MDTANHVVLACLAGRGPRPDTDRFKPLLKATCAQVQVDATLADAGYDSEPNHQYAREVQGVRSFMPATIGRPTTKLPSGRYRRQMKQRLNKHYGRYGQRWQVECTNSHDQASSDEHGCRPQLLGAMPRTAADRADLPMHAAAEPVTSP